MRMHSTRANPRSISRAARNGNAALDMSCVVTEASSSRERGPWMLICAYAPVTSVTNAWASPRCRRSQVSACRCVLSEATTQNRSSSSLVTVRSASIVPPSLSHWVYVMTPASPLTRLAEIRSSARPASRPWTRNFDMNDMSMRITPSRAARCSASQWGNQLCRPQDRASTTGRTPSGAYQSGLSQPDTSLKYAPRSTSRRCSGENLAPRAERLAGTGRPVLRVALVPVQPVDVEPGHVDVGPPVQDPAGERLPDPAAGQDADRVQPGRHEVVAKLGCLADHRLQVGREALRAAEVGAYTGVQRDRDALHRLFQVRRGAVPVRWQLAEGEVLRYSLDPPRRAPARTGRA